MLCLEHLVIVGRVRAHSSSSFDNSTISPIVPVECWVGDLTLHL